ncbi:MAG: hypothetical protein P9L99_05735 [Candidatus Lernaella stagnicola]|nr:hypothetical protein [Candidatus Lernaella stagnicola]
MKHAWMWLLVITMFVACTPAEQADELAALQQGDKPPTQHGDKQLAKKVAELQECCDENSRAMGAECCAELDRLVGAHQKPTGMDAKFKTGRPIDVPPEIAAQWPRVRLVVGPKGQEGNPLEVAVGAKAKIEGTPLEVEVVAFVPTFKMTGQAITTDGAEPKNPAAKVVIREPGKEEWSGWLFAKMPEVHAYPGETVAVLLLEGVRQEAK